MRRRGSHRNQRDVHGIVLLDKPVGDTSNAALQKVKRLFHARKAGHTGSLDPLASGLLPICLGEATKVSAFLLDADKGYRVTARLGVRTETGDADGRVIEERAVAPGMRERIEASLEGFRGEVQQVPPMYSAIKHQGRRLYELARDGVEVERKARTVTVHRLELLRLEGDDFTLEVSCSKGTYVRTLVEDIAAAAGSCAHVVALRRLSAGPYEASGCVTLERLAELAEQGPEALDGVLLPIDSALARWPSVTLTRDSAWYLQNGQPVMVPRAPAEGLIRLYAADGRFLGVGEITSDGRVAPRRLFRT